MEILSEQKCFGGVQGFYRHPSAVCGTPMRFGIFTPERKGSERFPVLTYLAGLTCTEETFAMKAGAQRFAAERGIMLVMPDTSPRGANIAGEDDDWDFGTGAGFYLDAESEPWARNYNMYSYVRQELQGIVGYEFPADLSRQGIIGHSMGGHGALVLHLRNPDLFKSVSAFAPISAPSKVPWGRKAFSNYLGPDENSWKAYDASVLVRERPSGATMLVDQGLSDKFLERELRPELLEEACKASGQKLNSRRHEGYDHSYYFIQTFIADHIRHHAEALT